MSCSQIKDLNSDCWNKILSSLEFCQLFKLRLVSTSWYTMISSILENVKTFALFGPEAHLRSQLPIGRANCSDDNHQIDVNRRISLQSVPSRSDWRPRSDSLIATLTNNFPHLTVLMIDCFGYWLSADQWRSLSIGCPNLVHINIIHCSRMDEIIHFTGKCLRHLEMHHCFFADSKKIETFLQRNPLVDVLVFQGSENLEINLQFKQIMASQCSTLSLVGSYLGTTFLKQLTESPNNRITSLRISFVNNKQFKMICSSLAQQLTCFEFWSNIVEICDLAQLNKLQQLTFACTGVRSSNFNQDLSLMVHGTPSLVSLSIKCPFLNDNSVEIISKGCSNLISLRLIECNFKETTNIALKQLTRLKNLEFLEFTRSKIENENLLEFIGKMACLRLISIPNNPKLSDNLLTCPILETSVIVKITIDGLNTESFTVIQYPRDGGSPDRIILIGEINYEQSHFVRPMPMIPRL